MVQSVGNTVEENSSMFSLVVIIIIIIKTFIVHLLPNKCKNIGASH